MHEYKEQFISLAIKEDVIRFGEFKLKSGRISPYFFNAGLFCTGYALDIIGTCYANLISEYNFNFDVLFGPAYKGIPIVSATAIALSKLTTKSIPYAFDRKEVKDHGEGGMLVGSEVSGKQVLLLDDVITAGTAIKHTITLLTKAGANIAGVVVAFDRQEKGHSNLSAVKELENSINKPVKTIVTFSDLIEYMTIAGDEKIIADLKKYREIFGII